MSEVPHHNSSNISRTVQRKGNSWWLLLVVSLVLSSCSSSPDLNFEFQEGDIILQSLNSSQCEAVRKATDSYYSHCGIVLNDDGIPMVYEAIGPVIKSSIEDFTSSGINGHFVVLRYDGLLDEHLDEMKDYCDGELGKPYDIYFNWDDTEIYCSELVWKAYAEAKISLCDLRPLSNYNLDSPEVKAIMNERYGELIPTNELMVAPSDLHSSDNLEVVFENDK